VDFNLIPRTELRDFITYVPNNSMIVDGTIRDNLKVRRLIDWMLYLRSDLFRFFS
jgi:ABC-type multidrug transport system fused ATPase/permease subunit